MNTKVADGTAYNLRLAAMLGEIKENECKM